MSNVAIYCKKKKETRPKKHFKNEQRSKDAAAKKTNTSGVGKINNYEDIYIPPYNNTDKPYLYIVTIPRDSTHSPKLSSILQYIWMC